MSRVFLSVGSNLGDRLECLRRAVDQLRDDHILGGAEIGQQMVELVDEAQCLAADAGAGAIGQIGRFFAFDADRAFEPALEQPDRLEQGRLARA